MAKVKTVAVEDGNSYRIINESDFDEKTMTKFSGPLPRDTVSDLTTRNGDGTFSEPTPSDIRYPNMDKTEFANNHGAYANKSAAEMRQTNKLADAPGGLDPDPALEEPVKQARETQKDANARTDDAIAKAAKTTPDGDKKNADGTVSKK